MAIRLINTKIKNSGGTVLYAGPSSSNPTLDYGQTQMQTVVQPNISGLTHNPFPSKPFNQDNRTTAMQGSEFEPLASGAGMSDYKGSLWQGYRNKNGDFVSPSGIDGTVGPLADKAANPTYAVPGSLFFQTGTNVPEQVNLPPRTL